MQPVRLPAGFGPFRYDADGNLVAGPGWEADYDAENRLVELIRNGIRKKFHYNVLDQRVQTETGGRAGNSCCHDHRETSCMRFRPKKVRAPLSLLPLPAGGHDRWGRSPLLSLRSRWEHLALTGSDGALVATYAYSPLVAACPAVKRRQSLYFQRCLWVIDEGEGFIS